MGSWGWGLLALLVALAPASAAAPVRSPSPQPPRASQAGPFRLTATAAVLMDAESGQVLFGRNPSLVWPPASTTKIMTALVALERAHLDTPIGITSAAAGFRIGSVLGLPADAKVPLRDLLYAMMLSSANDVAVAVAQGVGGSVPAFAALMNERAAQLGATQTHFTSPHGLYDRDHFSTAYDLALITRAAMQNPTFREIVHTRRWMFSVPGRRPRWLINHNKLLAWYPGADGVKTGYVHQSGHTLVASATRNNLRLIAVLLNPRDLWGDAARLLDYGFTHFHAAPVTSGPSVSPPP
ncbi:MAG: D-alanyl-D-alanine carboxypeptidase [Bacillati bacterium ANGP1]|uniref:D-alanyl-D-alanine carboxypeptidase n=1 Tax=Candidatus Segetimicrobium genomatis TaxID=2569760 RepID=A0A537K0J7_9BACT|nr:MAG: D-alanyl-D-alanine carboxypeptidase [Terrabacteria group bacterium ANGP1]